ncbi:VOC family protein [Streptomyces sp. NPDC051561]|uniref:VOC family protein n=1 Tax=Streptomyces sp. NPDC051561 TaxID=3365658 RepID=UPI0037A1157E
MSEPAQSDAAQSDVTKSDVTQSALAQINPTFLYADARAAIRMLKEAFGFREVVVYEDENDPSVVHHAELAYGNGVVLLGSKGRPGLYAQLMDDSGPTGVYVVVEDTDAHFKNAQAYGLEVLMPPTDQDHGSRDYMVRDAERNLWCFGTYQPGTPSPGAA